MPRGQSTRTRQLSLDLGRPLVDWTRVTHANHVRHLGEAQRQLARCERMLRAEALAETPPRYRRCATCDGMEDTTKPHDHQEAA